MEISEIRELIIQSSQTQNKLNSENKNNLKYGIFAHPFSKSCTKLTLSTEISADIWGLAATHKL